MKKIVHFVAILRTLISKSYKTMVLKEVKRVAPEKVVMDLSIAELPSYNFALNEKTFPESVETRCSTIKSAHALIVVTPEYNYSIPGALKNAIDFLCKHPTKPSDQKAARIVSASPGLLGGIGAQLHLRQIVVAANALSMNITKVVRTHVNVQFDETGNLTDGKTRWFFKSFVEALASRSYL